MSTSSASGNPRVVIIGRGWGVNIQVPAFKHAGWDVEAVITRSESDEQPSNQAYKVVHESQLENVLKSPLVKLVTITSPPLTHANYFQTINQFNKQSNNSKVHILCEKPFAMNLAEAKSMVSQLREAQLSNDQSTNQTIRQSINQFAPYGWVDHELRCLKAVKLTRDFVAAEAFGPVHSVTILHIGSLSVKPAYSWWNDAAQRGGVLGAVGSHMIDLLHFLTGSSIDVVSAQLNTANPDKIDPSTNQTKAATSDDYASLVGTAITNQSNNHKFPLSVTVTNNSGGFVSRKNCLIAGRNQSIELDLETLTVTAWVEGKKQVLIEGQDYIDSEVETIKLTKNPFAAGTVLLARQLREIVMNDNPIIDADLATFEDGLKVQAVMDAIYQSADGKSVKVAY